MWIVITLIIVFILVPLTMRFSGADSTYGVVHYNMQRVFTGTQAACENWIENKIRQEKEKLILEMEKMCIEHNLPKQDISEELRQVEMLNRQNYKVVRLN
ncbi:MAG: hypothetical protein ACK5KL_01790 [Dysgonomonas sp.]